MNTPVTNTPEQHQQQILIDRYSRIDRLSRRHKLKFAVKRLIWLGFIRGTYAIKRAFDIATSAILLLLLSPLFAAMALLIRLDSPGPIFFGQTRVGRWGDTFKMWKFRSMYIDAEQRKAALMAQNEMAGGVLFKMQNDPRITRIGRFIRRASIDELPQLWNVLKGDMSLIGPRPLLVEYLPRYNARQRCRHKVTPGITGLAQVAGRNLLSWEARFEHDVAYVREVGPALDCWILWRTLRGLGDTSATVPTGGKDVSTFMGNPGSHSEGEADAIETTRDARSLERANIYMSD